MHHIAVIDYGMGNLRSVSKALEAVSSNASVVVTSDPKTILSASHVLFPGVGAIRDCMAELKQLELEDVILQAAQEKPFLGWVCKHCCRIVKKIVVSTRSTFFQVALNYFDLMLQ